MGKTFKDQRRFDERSGKWSSRRENYEEYEIPVRSNKKRKIRKKEMHLEED